MKSSDRIKLLMEEVEVRLRYSRNGVLIRVLGGRPAVSLAEAADAAVELGFKRFTLGAMVRALRDEDALTIHPSTTSAAVFDLAATDKRFVSEALRFSHEHGGALEGAARELGLSLAGLRQRMRRYHLQADGSPAEKADSR